MSSMSAYALKIAVLSDLYYNYRAGGDIDKLDTEREYRV